MRYAVISDIHANILALSIALQDAKKEHIDDFIFLGDYVTDSGNSNQVVDIVRNVSKYAILGNREKYILNYQKEKEDYESYRNIADTYKSLSEDNLNYINSLCDFKIIEINGFKILMLHGEKYYSNTNSFDKMYDKIIEDYDFDLCLFGHTHIYADVEYKNKRFINPGAIGQPADYPTYKYCIVEITDKIDVKLKEFDVSDTYNILKSNYENSNHYNRNRIWESLILMNIKDGKDYCGPFVKMYNDKIKDITDITVEQANSIYHDTYEFYQENILNSNKKHLVK